MSDSVNIQTADQDDAMIMQAYWQLLDGYMNSNHRKKKDVIEKAFKFARAAHAGVRRRSGEPYIMHPLALATIVNQEIGLGSTSICAALLHDVVEDTDFTVEDIEAQFGKKVAQIVEGLTKISGGIFGDMASTPFLNFHIMGGEGVISSCCLKTRGCLGILEPIISISCLLVTFSISPRSRAVSVLGSTSK